jgi:hypothetical protein
MHLSGVPTILPYNELLFHGLLNETFPTDYIM